MPRTLKLPATTLLIFGLALSMFGCESNAPAPASLPSGNIPVETLPEGGEPLKSLDSTGTVTWEIAPGVGGTCKADTGTLEIVRQAVESTGQELAGVDYTGLSLSRLVTVTQKLKLDATSWNGGELEREACGSEGGKVKWHLFGVKGPEFEQLPNQTLVHRWPHIYALYDVDAKAVTKLVATIRGYVLE